MAMRTAANEIHMQAFSEFPGLSTLMEAYKSAAIIGRQHIGSLKSLTMLHANSGHLRLASRIVTTLC